jgi:hypothetical protein
VRGGGEVVDQGGGGVLDDQEAGVRRVLIADEERGESIVGRGVDEFVGSPLAD